MRTVNFKESSLIFHLLGEKFGTSKIIALGVKRPTNPFKGTVSPGNIVEIVYYKKESAEFGKMREISLIWKPEKVTRDYRKFLIMGFLLKIIYMYTIEGVKVSGLFKFTEKMLKEINEVEPKRNVVYSLVLKFLSVIGVGPEIEICLRCSQNLQKGYFIINEGGVFCEDCASNFFDKVFIDRKNLAYFRFLRDKKLKSVKNLKIENDENLKEILLNFTNFYLGETICKDFKEILKREI